MVAINVDKMGLKELVALEGKIQSAIAEARMPSRQMEEMGRRSRIDDDRPLRVINDPGKGWKPAGPFALDHRAQDTQEAAARRLKLGSFDPDATRLEGDDANF